MQTNSTFKNKDRLKMIQKAIIMAIGATASKESIKRAAVTLYDDIQSEVHKLLHKLETQGKVKAKETKKLISELQKKSEVEKEKIYKKLKKDSKVLLNNAKNLILTPIAVIKSAKAISKNPRKSKTISRKRK